MEQVARSSHRTKSGAEEKCPPTAGGKLRKENSDGCCVGPGEIDSILYISAYFSSFFLKKENPLIVTLCLFLGRVCHVALRVVSRGLPALFPHIRPFFLASLAISAPGLCEEVGMAHSMRFCFVWA